MQGRPAGDIGEDVTRLQNQTKLPPGYTSLTAPESSTPGVGYPALGTPGAPTLPPGYIPIDGGPPPPGWYDQPPADPAAPPTPVVPLPPQ